MTFESYLEFQESSSLPSGWLRPHCFCQRLQPQGAAISAATACHLCKPSPSPQPPFCAPAQNRVFSIEYSKSTAARSIELASRPLGTPVRPIELTFRLQGEPTGPRRRPNSLQLTRSPCFAGPREVAPTPGFVPAESADGSGIDPDTQACAMANRLTDTRNCPGSNLPPPTGVAAAILHGRGGNLFI